MGIYKSVYAVMNISMWVQTEWNNKSVFVRSENFTQFTVFIIWVQFVSACLEIIYATFKMNSMENVNSNDCNEIHHTSTNALWSKHNIINKRNLHTELNNLETWDTKNLHQWSGNWLQEHICSLKCAYTHPHTHSHPHTLFSQIPTDIGSLYFQ